MNILTGIKPTGDIHLGNYAGAIKPAISLSNQSREDRHIFLIADLHSIGARDVRENSFKLAATFIALGAPPHSLILRQSDLSDISKNVWALASVANVGMLKRGHAYKAMLAAGVDSGEIDCGILMYPILMASDIITLDADQVFVGSDQIQHIQVARDLVGRFNARYKTNLKMPTARFSNSAKNTLPGLDGRKMSKSYRNTIPLWGEPDVTRKLISRIITDSNLPGEPKTKSSALFQIHSSFLDDSEVEALSVEYDNGIGWGDAKELCFEDFEKKFKAPRAEFHRLMKSPEWLDRVISDSLADVFEFSNHLTLMAGV